MGDSRPFASRGTSVWMLVALVCYTTLAVLGYYDGFFRHIVNGGTVSFLPSGVTVAISPNHSSLVAWARIPLSLGSLYALGYCAWALWVGRPGARLACFAVFFGLLLPQTFLYALYLHGLKKLPLGIAILFAATLWGVPTAILGRPQMFRRYGHHEAGMGWSGLRFGHRRLLLTLVLLAWLGLASEVSVSFMAHWIQWDGYIAGNLAMILAVVSALGLLRLRTWALFTAWLTAALSSVALSAAFRIGEESGMLPHTWARVLDGVVFVPPLLIVGIAWPFWRVVIQRVAGRTVA